MTEENGIVQSTGGKAAKRPSRRNMGKVSDHPLTVAAQKATAEIEAIHSTIIDGRDKFVDASAYNTAEQIGQTSNLYLQRLGEAIEEVVESDPEAFREEGRRICESLFPLG